MTIDGPLLRLDPEDLKQLADQGANLPSVDPPTYSLLDDDAKVCQIISQDDLEASYVDNNIATFQLTDVNPVILDVDNEMLLLTYQSGAQTTIKLGVIDWDQAIRADQYVKTGGIIYPIDEAGNLMLNKVNAPNLVNIRTWYHDQVRQAAATNQQFAEIVYSFAQVLSLATHLDGVQ